MLIIDGNAVYEVDPECMRRRSIDARKVYGDKIQLNGEEVEEEHDFPDVVQKERYTGRGVTVAVLDTGIYPHPDFEERILCFEDFVTRQKLPYDKNGHGTHAWYLIITANNLFTF